MKNLLLLIAFTMVAMSSQAQTKLFVHDKAEKYVKKTKTLAIIPLQVEIKLRPKKMKELKDGELEEMQRKEALNIQKSMHSWFLNKKKKGDLLVGVQSPKKTNALLKEAGIDPNVANDELASKLCEILGVEGIVGGTFETNKPMSGGLAAGLAVIGIGGATNNATINLDIIHNDDEIIVNYLKNLKGGLGSSTDDLINVLMRKTARRIPYTN